MALRVTATAGSTSTFTVTTWPSNPYVGEAVRVYVEGSGGHTATNNLRDIWVETDVGEAGATFESATAYDAETAPGRFFTHCYASSGTKTMTHTSWTFDSANKTQQTSVTVTDPDAETWDMTYWVDFNGSTTGMDAEDASNTHILSQADWTAARNASSTGQKIRVRFRGGSTHTFTTAQNWLQAADVVYVDTFDSGKAIIADGTGTYTGWEVFAPSSGSTAPRWIFCNLDLQGSYDPITGYTTDGLMSLFDGNIKLDAACSAWRVKARGCDALMTGSGGNGDGYDYRFAYVDCDVADWFEYGLGFTGSSYDVFVRGCKVKQNPITPTGDAKPNTNPEKANHGPIRVARFYRCGIAQNEMVSRNGWSAYGSDYAIQPAVRIYIDANPTGGEAVILMNKLEGRYAVEYGSDTASDSILTPAQVLVACNDCNIGRHGRDLVQAHTGGIHVYSNVAYMPKLESSYTSLDYYIVEFIINRTNSTSAWQNPSYVGFNTFFSDMDGTVTNSTGPIYYVREQTSPSGGAQDLTVENNYISAAGHSAGDTSVAASAFARGDKFRPITSGAADSTVTSGPPVDIDGVKRTNPTNKGAHHAAGSDVSVSAPSNSVAPTIALNPYVALEYLVTDKGTWSNADDFMCDWTWEVNGSESPNSTDCHLPWYDDATTGTLTCKLGVTNRSGTRVTATSNSVSI